jgi:SAM-dependent methyltransferase
MRDPKTFDPARAHVLDAPERERCLPTEAILALLALDGDETVLDYGAGTGRLSAAVADALSDRGAVIAVDESAEMFERLATRLDGVPHARPLRIADNPVPLADACVHRILAVSLRATGFAPERVDAGLPSTSSSRPVRPPRSPECCCDDSLL